MPQTDCLIYIMSNAHVVYLSKLCFAQASPLGTSLFVLHSVVRIIKINPATALPVMFPHAHTTQIHNLTVVCTAAIISHDTYMLSSGYIPSELLKVQHKLR